MSVAALGEAFRHRAAVGRSFWYMGHLMTILASSEETGGQFALIEAQARRGHEPPPHVHQREDETYYIIEGEARFDVGGQTIEAGPGACVFLPRGVPHGFSLVSDRVRVLILVTPGGFERWFLQFATPAPTLDLPPPGTTTSYADVERIVAAGAGFGIEFVPLGATAS